MYYPSAFPQLFVKTQGTACGWPQAGVTRRLVSLDCLSEVRYKLILIGKVYASGAMEST